MLENINQYWLAVAFAIIIIYAWYQRELNQIEKYYRKEIRILEEKIDESHVAFNQLVDVETIQHFLYRDFPDDLNTTKLTETSKSYTIKEVVEATKNIDPKIWKN